MTDTERTHLKKTFQKISDWALWIEQPELRDEDKRAAKIAAICDDEIAALTQ